MKFADLFKKYDITDEVPVEVVTALNSEDEKAETQQMGTETNADVSCETTQETIVPPDGVDLSKDLRHLAAIISDLKDANKELALAGSKEKPMTFDDALLGVVGYKKGE